MNKNNNSSQEKKKLSPRMKFLIILAIITSILLLAIPMIGRALGSIIFVRNARLLCLGGTFAASGLVGIQKAISTFRSTKKSSEQNHNKNLERKKKKELENSQNNAKSNQENMASLPTGKTEAESQTSSVKTEVKSAPRKFKAKRNF